MHDLWLDVNRINIDSNAGTISIPLSDEKFGSAGLFFVCSGVMDVEIIDTEQVDKYTIYGIRLDKLHQTLEIVINIPLKIIVNLDDTWKICLKRNLDSI